MSGLRRRVIVTNAKTREVVYNGLEDCAGKEEEFADRVEQRGASVGRPVIVQVRRIASW